MEDEQESCKCQGGQMLGSGVRILYHYQIYFRQLLCFQEISVTESHGQNSTLNSAVKP